MKVLLLRDVRKLGHIGDVVDVRVGYARNYLYPQRLATEPTEENLKAIEEEKQRAAAERARRLKEYQKLAEALADVTVTIEANANPEGTLYGSVGVKEIAAALQEMGHPIDAEFIDLAEPIRTLDNRVVTIQFTDEVSAEIKLWVVRAGELKDGQAGDGDEHATDGDEYDDFDDESDE